jgi:hypothetical protein
MVNQKIINQIQFGGNQDIYQIVGFTYDCNN